jgi:rhodanese-related sulfurtransferase
MAVGILQRKGFKKVASLAGGSEAWIKAGLPVYGADTQAAPASSASTASKREIKLPERLAPSAVKQLVLDLPGSFDLVDIRPPEQFRDFNIPGSVNADVADVLSNPAYLTGVGPLILVDRDGSLAMAVAGILSQKTQRPIKAMHGGLEAYWEASELKSVIREIPMGSSGGGAPAPPDSTQKAEPSRPASTPSPGPAPVPPAPQKPAPAKSKSAGC